MQFGSRQALPMTRARNCLQYRAVAATDLKKLACARKEFIRETDDKLISSYKPEMLVLDFRKEFESRRVHSADGIGKFRREHRDALALCDHMAARRTSPSKWPDRLARRNGI